MKDPVRRDTLLTIIGLALLVAGFMFAVYVPGKKACATSKRDIRAAQQMISDIPVRVAELEALANDVRKRGQYLQTALPLLPVDADLHSVVAQVSDLARKADLAEGAFEPLAAVKHKTYQVSSFRFSFSGQFRGIVAFLSGLENSDRLVTVDELSLTSSGQDRLGSLEGAVIFSVYARSAGLADSAENNASSSSPPADKE